MATAAASTSRARTVSKQNASEPAASVSGNVTKRLQSELMGLMMQSHEGITAFPTDNLLVWTGQITGPAETVYAGLTYKIRLTFGQSYPMTAPIVRFEPETPCYHPNVDLARGDICIDILKEEWSSAFSVSTILLSLQSLLGEPNNRSPLNVEAADLWDDQTSFKKQVLASHSSKPSSA
ncbi:uncharacterized protein L969DRAFT_85304 [Mixia osmundae IAM 14324]|uniref:UBC core domain-containing protein n=1 Tax=Mixia osmundae (strain CBS 9802 / IAM 14324 / JCM 22182 / KY 12970) TaxID=764103 RepID=G7DYF4_MIXOS|nr:uncharacterized protein L969DRAFT_85304 [Mixia osmundae IAM 14324]KEI41516.1 hypothetical protein L969DRAFT_85304 [Mixia osmundae IAM 14324]GAA95614.1 hypothetical protein E5Q_02270 [Mixia osmundae IAM 14324]